MPANKIVINGELEYTLGDSFTEPLVMFLERYCYENIPDGEDCRDTIFAAFLRAWAKAHYAHYGNNEFDFDTCVVKMDIEPDVHVVSWSHKPMSEAEYGELMQSFEPETIE